MTESVPTGWARDTLTQYLDACRGNQFATFANKRSQVIDLITIDAMLCKLLDGAVNPRPMVPMDFLRRAHSAYCTAVGATMSGQIYEAQALLRLCLEHGAYARFIGDDDSRWERWMNRHDSETARKLVRREFHHTKILAHIRAVDNALADTYSTLYERVIDYGAHPNERGVSLSERVKDTEDGGKQIDTIYLHEDGLMLNYGLKTAAQVGLWVLHTSRTIYPARIKALGVHYQIDDMRKRY